MIRAPRSAFTPEALSTFEQTMDEVWKELLADDAVSPLKRDGLAVKARCRSMRTRLARKLISFASSGWSPVQIKQLLLRTLRNERRETSDLTLARPSGTDRARAKMPQSARKRYRPRRPAAGRGPFRKFLRLKRLCACAGN
jgi:hypothetical protein